MERRLLQRCTIFDLYLSSRRCADGKTGGFYLLAAPPWVNVVPVVRDGQGRDCFLMVRQYRHGVGRITVEFPAGLVNEGEEPEAAARRELLEETGRLAGSLELIGTIAPNPAFMSNWCYTYLCRDPQETGRQELDEQEVLEVLRVPVREVVERMGQDGYINAMALAALYWYLRHRGGLQP